TKTRSLPTRLAARNTLLRTTRLWKDITRSGDRERDQGDVLLRRRRLPNVEMAWRIQRNVSQLFTKAREVSENGQPAIVFIDEIDSLMGGRGEEVGGEVRVRNQFLKEMDGILDKNKKLHVYLIGATNKPWVLDEDAVHLFEELVSDA